MSWAPLTLSPSAGFCTDCLPYPGQSFTLGSALSPLTGTQSLVSLGTRPHQEPSSAAHGTRHCWCSCHPGHDKGFGSSVPGTGAETNLYKFCYLTVTSFPIPRSLSRWSQGLGAVLSVPARHAPHSAVGNSQQRCGDRSGTPCWQMCLWFCRVPGSEGKVGLPSGPSDGPAFTRA